jgi:hypothetical protein
VDHIGTGGIPEYKTSPGSSGTPQTSPPYAELSLATDASDNHIGGVMQQKSGDHWRPLGFFSRKLTDMESRYSTFDRELLAAFATIRHSRHFCEGAVVAHW